MYSMAVDRFALPGKECFFRLVIRLLLAIGTPNPVL